MKRSPEMFSCKTKFPGTYSTSGLAANSESLTLADRTYSSRKLIMKRYTIENQSPGLPDSCAIKLVRSAELALHNSLPRHIHQLHLNRILPSALPLSRSSWAFAASSREYIAPITGLILPLSSNLISADKA